MRFFFCFVFVFCFFLFFFVGFMFVLYSQTEASNSRTEHCDGATFTPYESFDVINRDSVLTEQTHEE